jgi:hypothetical protein
VGAEIVENDVEFAIREADNDVIHGAEKLHAAQPLRMRGYDLPGGNFQRCKQGGGAVPRVVWRFLRPILQPGKAVIGKPPPPVADDAGLNTNFLGDRACAAALGRPQHYSSPLRLALGSARRSAAPQAPSVPSA